MRTYDKRRKVMKQHRVMPKSEMRMPDKNIPVIIRPGLIVFTDSADKIDLIRKKYEHK